MLADLAVTDPAKFGEIAEQAKAALRRNKRVVRREIFARQAVYCDGRSPLYAELCRRLADDPRVGDVAPDLDWDFPLRLLGGAALPRARAARRRGTTSARALERARASSCALVPRSRRCRRTRCSAPGRSCPAFLSLADGRPFDLLELGPSAGLNLLWDRYRYRYSTGAWGSGALELAGDDRTPPPAELLRAARLGGAAARRST